MLTQFDLLGDLVEIDGSGWNEERLRVGHDTIARRLNLRHPLLLDIREHRLKIGEKSNIVRHQNCRGLTLAFAKARHGGRELHIHAALAERANMLGQLIKIGALSLRFGLHKRA